MAYGKHLKIVRSQEYRDKRAAWYRSYYAKKLKVANPKKRGRVADPEARAAKASAKREEAQHSANIRAFLCRKCSNHRAFLPDTPQGKCRICARRKHHKAKAGRKQRLIAAGRWGVIVRLRKATSRAHKKGCKGSFVERDWMAILEKYGNRCLCCGSSSDICIDHVVPVCHGGPHDPSNIQPLCRVCNGNKGTAVIDYRPDRPLAPMRRDPVTVRYVHGTE